MTRYAELLRSETAATILHALIAKMDIVNIQENYLKICKPYIETPDKADVLHAATCLQKNAALISNDHHFNRIRDEGIIKVWSTTEAIKKLLENPIDRHTPNTKKGQEAPKPQSFFELPKLKKPLHRKILHLI